MMIADTMTTKNVAQILGLHTVRVGQLLKEGKLTAQRFGPAWAIPSWSVLEFLKARDGMKRRKK